MRILSIVGARPQFIKLTALVKAIAQNNARRPDSAIGHQVLHTGQHYDAAMSGAFFAELALPTPDYNLGVGSGPHGQQTARMLEGIEAVLQTETPDLVLVYGDTNSTLAGALAAAKLHIPLGHVEAGLRSHNRRMPEEINRVLTDHVADLLFCPTETAIENLRREGIDAGVYLVGDVMYDCVLEYSRRAAERSDVLTRLGLGHGSVTSNYYLATVHRAENTDDPCRLDAIYEALTALASGGVTVVWPVHPRTRKALGDNRAVHDNLRLIEPVSYLDMLLLEQHARLILTDSGGVQKEAFFFHVPCVTLRDETEWIETVNTGWNRLASADTQRILEATRQAVTALPDTSAQPYGDGHAAEKIVRVCLEYLSHR